MNGRLKGLIVLVLLIGAAYVARDGEKIASVAAAQPETYRLVHAIGNDEHVSAKDLSKAECEKSERELKKVATALGTYNERTGYGSITCLPESFFTEPPS